MNHAVHRQRVGGIILLAAGVAVAALLGPQVPGLTPWSQSASAADGTSESCIMLPEALDPNDLNAPNPEKEKVNGVLIAGAFGPAVEVRGEEKVKKELKERRSCGADGHYDTYLPAAQYAEWSHYGLTSVHVGDTDAEINAFAAKIKANPSLYAKTLAELEKLEGESTYSEEAVPQGIWSMYMTPDGNGGVKIHFGRTSSPGTNAVFTHGDVQVKYRLDCGFQPNRAGFEPPPGVDICTGTECAPPPVCDEGLSGTWPDCYTPCPPGWYGEREPDCYQNKWVNPSPTGPYWDQRGLDNGLTNGQQSRDQITSGETRGNAVNDQVNGNTGAGDTTNDTVHSSSGGPVADGAQAGGDNQDQGAVDTENTNQNEGGVEGDTCVPDERAGITCDD